MPVSQFTPEWRRLPTFASMTNHPLFENTYWGGMRYDSTDELHNHLPSVFNSMSKMDIKFPGNFYVNKTGVTTHNI